MSHTWRSLQIFATAGAGGGVAGALTHDTVMAWAGATIAVGSLFLTAALAAYHKWCEVRRTEESANRAAVREEDRKDRQSDRDEVKAMGLAAIEAEGRLDKLNVRLDEAERAATDLATLVNKIRCRFPTASGEARCTDPAYSQRDVAPGVAGGS